MCDSLKIFWSAAGPLVQRPDHGRRPARGIDFALRDSAVLWPNLPEEGLSLEEIERELISGALDKFKGNQTQAARYLDISRRTLIYRMEKHGLAVSEPEI
jgi:DNA-binding NtrC family response regulator